jgi:hypothetical protein
VAYFHNTTNGDLYPSRQQIHDFCGVRKETIIATTRKMQRFGYLTFRQSNGGRNEKNTYYLRKNGHQKGTVSETETVTKMGLPQSQKGDPRQSQKGDTQISIESILRGEASPSPCNGKASASQEKKMASIEEQVSESVTELQAPTERPISEEERKQNVKKLDRLLGALRRR